MIAIGTAPLLLMQEGSHVNPQPDGSFTVSMPDDTVLSVQPNGALERRPAGSNGIYERCTIQGGYATYRPVPGAVYVFGFVGALPQ